MSSRSQQDRVYMQEWAVRTARQLADPTMSAGGAIEPEVGMRWLEVERQEGVWGASCCGGGASHAPRAPEEPAAEVLPGEGEAAEGPGHADAPVGEVAADNLA